MPSLLAVKNLFMSYWRDATVTLHVVVVVVVFRKENRGSVLSDGSHFLKAQLDRVQGQDDGRDEQSKSQEGGQRGKHEDHHEEELKVRHPALNVGRLERNSSVGGHRVGESLLERHLGGGIHNDGR